MTPDPASTDPRTEALARLTAPGARFEVIEEEVRGHRMEVFADRRRSLHEVLVASAAHGDREYLVCGQRRMSFTEHLRRVASLQLALRTEHGVGQGDRVAILSANNAEWIETFWAVTSLGAVAVGMNSLWAAPEIAYAVEHAAPVLVVADAKRRALLGDVRVPVLAIEHVPRLAAADPGAALAASEIAEDDPATIIYTSGTTGRPKGATHSHRNVITAVDYFRLVDAVAAELGAAPGHRRILLAAPLFHIMSLHNLAVPRLVMGDTVVLHTGRFDVDRVLRLIEAERVTQWGAVPTMASRLIEHGDLSAYDLSSLRTISLGSAPSSAALKAGLQEVLPSASASLGTTYGLTESTSAATLASAADLAAHPDTVGSPVTTMAVQVRDERGRPAPDGVEGEIYLRGPQVMLGYWDDDAATDAAIDADGWLHTGDLGTMTGGRLWVSSRRSDLIIRAGENVYPTEVENVLATHPGVLECAVLGVGHPDLGQEVAAVVVGDPAALTQAELSSFLLERVARYKVPSRWVVTSEALARNATGKIVRHNLAGLLRESGTTPRSEGGQLTAVGFVSHRSTQGTPRGWKCLVFRVATVMSADCATAAMSASSNGACSGTR